MSLRAKQIEINRLNLDTIYDYMPIIVQQYAILLKVFVYCKYRRRNWNSGNWDGVDFL